MDRSKFIKETTLEELWYISTYDMGMQISCCVHSKVPKEDSIWELRKYLGGILKDLARDRGSEIEEGHLCSDHVHMVISIPPKFCVSEVIGYIKGKSAIYVARNFLGR